MVREQNINKKLLSVPTMCKDSPRPYTVRDIVSKTLPLSSRSLQSDIPQEIGKNRTSYHMKQDPVHGLRKAPPEDL